MLVALIKKDAIRELYDFIRFDYNPYHKKCIDSNIKE